MSRSIIANVESGRRSDLTIVQFLAVCMALRVPPVALIVDLDDPFSSADLTFPGGGAGPFGPEAPVTQVARWLNGQEPNETTPAAARATSVLGLLSAYRSDRDTLLATNIRGRLLRERGKAGDDVVGEERQLEERLRLTTDLLRQLGIEVPTATARGQR